MDFTTITLGAAAKAMSDTVLPALLAAGDRQALEQAHLVRDAITFVRDRADLIGERRRAEVAGLAELVARLLELDELSEKTATQLGALHAHSLRMLADAGVGSECWAALATELGAAVTALLHEADRLPPAVRSTVERVVLEHALRGVELDRAWLLPLGFDPEPARVRDLPTLLGVGNRHQPISSPTGARSPTRPAAATPAAE